jgi:hypothetical protein
MSEPDADPEREYSLAAYLIEFLGVQREIAKDVHTIAEDVRARWRAQAAKQAADEKLYADWRAEQEALHALRLHEGGAEERRERSFWERFKRQLWKWRT